MTTVDISLLSPAVRLDLIGRLWDSLDEDSVVLTVAMRAELDRRLGRADADLAASVSWENLRTELRSGRGVAKGFGDLSGLAFLDEAVRQFGEFSQHGN